ncbi:MAG: hypothetical protein AB2A00_39000, partial [Myxococcota bacterium]
GGRGGGIVFVFADYVLPDNDFGNVEALHANGGIGNVGTVDNGLPPPLPRALGSEGGGGGGAGGSVLLYVGSVGAEIAVRANGANGGDGAGTGAAGGGGGGAGRPVIYGDFSSITCEAEGGAGGVGPGAANDGQPANSGTCTTRAPIR